jgi:hypothetical protein
VITWPANSRAMKSTPSQLRTRRAISNLDYDRFWNIGRQRIAATISVFIGNLRLLPMREITKRAAPTNRLEA